MARSRRVDHYTSNNMCWGRGLPRGGKLVEYGVLTMRSIFKEIRKFSI